MTGGFPLLVLMGWIPVAVIAFATLRLRAAIILVVLGGMMLLPERVGIDLPALPELSKYQLPALLVLVGCIARSPGPLLAGVRGQGFDLIIFVMLAGNLMTMFTNGEPLYMGPLRLPGMNLYDGMSSVQTDLLRFGVPFLVGQAYFRRRQDMKLLVMMLVGAGLVYSVLVLWEVRMAPTLHRDIYGFFQQKMHMAKRLGGYRPRVFFPHGLALANFLLSVLVLSIAANRGRVKLFSFSIPPKAISVYLGLLFALCRSVTTYIFGLVTLPFLMFGSPKTIIRAAAIICLVVLSYPLLRTTKVISEEWMVPVAQDAGLPRVASMAVRLTQEAELLEKAREKMVFGWGGYGRNRHYDMNTGENLSTIDGLWISTLGKRGVVGFLCVFGLLIFPVFAAHRRLRLIRSHSSRVMLAGLCLVMAINTIDLIPNAFLSPIIIMTSGAIAGLVKGLPREERMLVARRRRQRRSSREGDGRPAVLPKDELDPRGGRRRRTPEPEVAGGGGA